MNSRFLCPECLSRLVIADDGTAQCSRHGRRDVYNILFAKPEMTAPAADAASTQQPLTQEESSMNGSVQIGLRCVRHPNQAAHHKCRSCGVGICVTCDFEIVQGIHLCPECATNPRTDLAPKRRKSVIWALVVASGNTAIVASILLGIPHLLTGDEQGAEVLTTIASYCVIILGITGVALGVGSLSKRAGNPALVWVAAIWNTLLLALWLLLCVVGLFMMG